MPTDSQLLDDAKQIIDTAKVLNQIDILRAKRITDSKPADTSNPNALPPYVLSGPSAITGGMANDACHSIGKRLPTTVIPGLENLRYFLADGSFVRMGNIVGEVDGSSAGLMVAWIVCEP